MATNLHQVKRGYADLKRSGTQMYYERMGHGAGGTILSLRA